MYIVILILLLALLWDVSLGIVPNSLFLTGVVLSQAWLIMSASVEDAILALVGGVALLILLFPIFAIGALGGGDVKLMMLLPVVWTIGDSIKIIFVAFVIGAVLGVCKLVLHRELLNRLRCLAIYVRAVNQKGKLMLYDLPSGGQLKRHQIHFTIPLLISVLLSLGEVIKI